MSNPDKSGLKQGFKNVEVKAFIHHSEFVIRYFSPDLSGFCGSNPYPPPQKLFLLLLQCRHPSPQQLFPAWMRGLRRLPHSQ